MKVVVEALIHILLSFYPTVPTQQLAQDVAEGLHVWQMVASFVLPKTLLLRTEFHPWKDKTGILVPQANSSPLVYGHFHSFLSFSHLQLACISVSLQFVFLVVSLGSLASRASLFIILLLDSFNLGSFRLLF